MAQYYDLIVPITIHLSYAMLFVYAIVKRSKFPKAFCDVINFFMMNLQKYSIETFNKGSVFLQIPKSLEDKL